MLENWLSWLFILNLTISSTLSSKLNFDSLFFSSSTRMIINPDEVLIGFENSPNFNLETISFIVLFNVIIKI